MERCAQVGHEVHSGGHHEWTAVMEFVPKDSVPLWVMQRGSVKLLAALVQ